LKSACWIPSTSTAKQTVRAGSAGDANGVVVIAASVLDAILRVPA
jgi:hypothetical protein